MNTNLERIPYRIVGEWAVHTDHTYAEPFTDVIVQATFTSPAGAVMTMPGFYDGEGVWRVRFSPNEVGQWTYAITSRPADEALTQSGTFEVTARETAGFLKATPGQGWGFHTESGEPVLLIGDTVYNLFGAAHCGMDVAPFLKRRAEQNFNILRVRVPVSPFHPPNCYSEWQTCRTWPWGGSEQSPRFDRFNLDYFRTVDKVMQLADEVGIGFEMIMEAWAFEYPFNNRAVFLPEWEELWLRYLIARYDAFTSTNIWTLMNEYEHYPGGPCRAKYESNRWAMRTARWVKATATHDHIIAVHNGGPRTPPFAERFATDPDAIDAVMFQDWGSGGEDNGWLAAGIEDVINTCFAGWQGVGVFSEWGYERNPDIPITFPWFEHTDAEHNRRGAWRGAFCGMGVINGFENTWGPVMDLENDQKGVTYFEILHQFFTEIVPFDQLQPAPDIIAPGEYEYGHQPLALATASRDCVAVYMPAGGVVLLDLPHGQYKAEWYNPRDGVCCVVAENVVLDVVDEKLNFIAEAGENGQGHAWDWVLVLNKVPER